MGDALKSQDKKLDIAVGFGVLDSVFGFEEEAAYAPTFFSGALSEGPPSDESGPSENPKADQKSICTPIFMKRGVNTDNGASHACDPVVAVGLNDWL